MRKYIEDLKAHGFCVIPYVFDEATVKQMRQTVLDNVELMSNTRPTKTAYQLAGFHRFPGLEALHSQISGNSTVFQILQCLYPGSDFVSLGLTDITINCSQPWHTDLLRGTYSHYLTGDICWGPDIRLCVKALLYLQKGYSLKVVPGSHKKPVKLNDDINVIPISEEHVQKIKLNCGEIILMDIRLIHRGPTEEEVEDKALGEEARILVSSVFGDRYSKLARAMSLGNAKRTLDWDILNSTGKKEI